MKNRLISAVLMVAGLLASLAPATAFADSTVRYANRSSQTLHVYYSVVAHGLGIDCQELTYGGVVTPDSSWELFVPSGSWTWVRFQEGARDGGCTSDSPRYEVWYSGSSYGYQAANVW